MTTTTNTSTTNSTATGTFDERALTKTLTNRSFCTLASTSPTGEPHSAGVLYVFVDGALYVNTLRASKKARNIAAGSEVSVCIPVRRLPIGPPSSIQFRAHAEILDVDDPALVALLEQRRLQAITTHGELDLPGACFLRIVPGTRFVTYGLGMPLRRLLRDPLHAGGSVEVRQ